MRVGGSPALLAAALVGALWAAPSSAQQDEVAQQNQIRTHVGHVADSFSGTPDGQGLLATAMAEAEVAVRHAELAARDTTDLEAMKLHVGHVLHAVDPTLVENGPGLGYGMKRAAEAVANHMDLAHAVEGASYTVRDYTRRVRISGRNTVDRADEIIDLAQQIREASTAAEAAPLVRELNAVSDAVIDGVDENNDGGVGWRRGEAGLEHARQNLNVLWEEVSAASEG